MSPALTVYYGRIEVGQLSLSPTGRMVFEYATAWKAAPHGGRIQATSGLKEVHLLCCLESIFHRNSYGTGRSSVQHHGYTFGDL